MRKMRMTVSQREELNLSKRTKMISRDQRIRRAGKTMKVKKTKTQMRKTQSKRNARRNTTSARSLRSSKEGKVGMKTQMMKTLLSMTQAKIQSL